MKINKRLNKVANRITTMSPEELLFERSIFDLQGRSFKEEITLAKEKRIKESSTKVKRNNEKRIFWDVQKGELVYKRNIHNEMLEDKFSGPYEVIKKNLDSGRITKKKITKKIQNIKNLRPAKSNCIEKIKNYFTARGEQDVVTLFEAKK